MKKLSKKVVSIIIAVVLCLISRNITPPEITNASVIYITVESFAKALAASLDVKPESGSTGSGYADLLLNKGIIKAGDFTSYTRDITRGDAMVLLNRADEYLYGDKSDADLVQVAIDKRISDIGKVSRDKREDVAKAYLKGYMKGYSNGKYSTDRTMKVNSKITKSGALSCIKLLTDKSKLAKISPDGQLIRTTNLPYSAKKFPYILDSYPNSYYDWKLCYELGDGNIIKDGKKIPYVKLVDYAEPKDVKNAKGRDDYYVGFSDTIDENLNLWVDKVQTHLEHVFSANYKTIDDAWVEEVMKTNYSYGYVIEKGIRKEVEKYVSDMKANKTIVEYAKINVDGSSLYFFNGRYYLRAYVKYRILSSQIKFGVDTNTLLADWSYNKILYSYDLVNFSDFTLGKWRECGYDICLGAYSDRDEVGIGVAILNENICNRFRITK